MRPSDVGVLARAPGRDLTLVTCYPFFYVGSAPERFIVHARKIGLFLSTPFSRFATGAFFLVRGVFFHPHLSIVDWFTGGRGLVWVLFFSCGGEHQMFKILKITRHGIIATGLLVFGLSSRLQ